MFLKYENLLSFAIYIIALYLKIIIFCSCGFESAIKVTSEKFP